MKYQLDMRNQSVKINSAAALDEGSTNPTFTWERLIPYQVADDSASRKFLELHFGRYETAARYVKGKRVLDIACGAGYGSRMLRLAGASTVVGVDICPETVQYAKKHYQESNMEFVCADAEEFEWSEQFDVIVSFETIEHVPHPDKFLERVRRLLVGDGIFLLSVPLGETRHFDPYHLHAFSQEEVFALLDKTKFLVDGHHCDQCFLTRSELLRWGQLYPESSPSLRELLFTRRGWQIIQDFVLRGGFDIPQLLVTARANES